MRKIGSVTLLAAATLTGALALTACSSSSSSSDASNDPSVAASFSVGDGSVQAGGELPSYWPSDVPTPDGLAYTGGAQLGESITGTFNGSTPIADVEKQLTADFKADGWTQDSVFGGGASGGVSRWTKGNQTGNAVITNEKGTTVLISIRIPK